MKYKQNMRRMMALLMALTLMIGLATPAVHAADVVQITFGQANGGRGDRVTVPVTIKNSPGIASFRFRVAFDAEELTFVSAAKGNVLTKGTLKAQYQEEAEEVAITWFDVNDATGDGVLFELTFDITGNGYGRYPLTVSYLPEDMVNAAWEELSCQVTDGEIFVGYILRYDANGGSGAPASASVIPGEAAHISGTIPTRSGHTFLGWSTSATASAPDYVAGDTIQIASDTTLYAVWQPGCPGTHDYTYSLTKAPTADATGTLTGTCSECVVVDTVVLPKLSTTDYNYQVKTAPDCTTAGVGQYTWKTTTYGIYSFEVAIPKTGHSYSTVVTKPTCTTGGYTTYTCVTCGYSYQADNTSPGAHSWAEATCTSPRTCTVCGITSGDPLNHTWNAATCTEPRTCAYCGATSGEPMGHSWRPADCLNPSSCVYCDATQGEALGHDYKVTTGICTMCGDVAPFQVDPPQMVSCYTKDYTYMRSTWTKVEGVDGYELYRSTDPNDLDSFVIVKSILDPEVTSYSNRLTTQGVTYYYRVCSFVFLEDGLTRVRSKLSEPMHMPSKVFWNEPYSNSDYRVRLRWYEVSGCHGYQIWIREEGGSYQVAKIIGDRGKVLTNDQGHVTAYSKVSLTAGQKYTFKMRAFFLDGKGNKIYGPYSDEVTVAVQPSAPSISGGSYAAGRAKVQWQMPCAADGYQVWMSEAPDSGFAIVKSVRDPAVTTYTKNGLESGKTYYFKIRAYSEVDGKKSFGAYSETIAIKIK